MSIQKKVDINGHNSKRRKLSHDSSDDEARSESLEDGSENARDDDEESSDDEDNREEVPDIDNDDSKSVSRRFAKAISEGKSSGKITTRSLSGSSNMLQFQVQNLLSNAKPENDTVRRRSKFTTEKLVSIIQNVPSLDPVAFAQAETYSRKALKVTIPWSQRPNADIKYKFSYKPPKTVAVADCSTWRQSVEKLPSINIFPEMPAEMFQEKDYLNHRAIHKRAFYLACITAAIRKQMGEEAQLRYSNLEENDLTPVLEARVNTDGSPIIYTICPSFPSTLCPVQKMRPSQNCLRNEEPTSKLTPEEALSPTYNSTVSWLASYPKRDQLLKRAALSADNFDDGCCLGGVWLRQRGFSSAQSTGGFGLEEWSFICALLLESGGHQGRPLFSPRYSAIQFFKAMLQVLSGRDMYNPYVVRGDMAIEAIEQPVIFDAITGLNVLYKMSHWSYARLKYHAALSLTAINSKISYGFESTFMHKVSEPALEYDEAYTIKLTQPSEGFWPTLQRMYKTLKTGFGDRTTQINLVCTLEDSWKVTTSKLSEVQSYVTVGLLINPDTSSRLVDHGPSVEDKVAAQEFRDFWADKAELRKFKDGRINESLVWSSESSVTKQIIYLLCEKYFQTPSDSILASSSLKTLQITDPISSDEAFAVVNTKFQSLSSTLHQLDGLPLPVRSVSPASELIRSSSVILPLDQSFVQPIDVIIQFDSSGRWPDDLRAIQYTKIAFLTKIGDLLSKHDRTIECRVGLDDSSTSTLGANNTSFLDVIYSSQTLQLTPLIFRLRIHHEREIYLIQQALSSNNTLSPPLRELYQSALQSQRRTLAEIAHTNAFRSLITIFPALSTTTRLLKRFFSVHHLSIHIPAETVELLAARAFLNPSPWSTPGSATIAFARVLYSLSHWDWTSEPFLVDLSLSHDMTLAEFQELETRFAAWRKMDPNMNSVAWFIGSNIDPTGVIWTQGTAHRVPQPSRVVASRVTALARAAVQIMKTAGQRETKIMTKNDWNEIFTSSLSDFDFIIRLKPSMVAGPHQKTGKSGAAKYKNLEIASALEVDTTGIDDITAYVQDLQHSFGSVALFFYGGEGCGSAVIGGLWRPHVRTETPRPWKIRLGTSTVPINIVNGGNESIEDQGSCMVNIEGMLTEMGNMGEGLVDRIVQRGPD